MSDQFKDLDSKEIELPDTVFVRDIESRVFQSITLQCLSKIEGIALLEGTFIDNLLGREAHERIKGIQVSQDQKNHAVSVRVEVNVTYGINIPQKAEEIQSKISQEISEITGLHVGSVHVVFKNLIPPSLPEELREERAEEKSEEEVVADVEVAEEAHMSAEEFADLEL